MKITLEESELHQAIIMHITSMGFNVANKDLSITLTAGRGANASNSVTIEINQFEDSAQEVNSDATAELATDPSLADSSPNNNNNDSVFDESQKPDPFT